MFYFIFGLTLITIFSYLTQPILAFNSYKYISCNSTYCTEGKFDIFLLIHFRRLFILSDQIK
jgi:hypothetical protein